MLALCLVGCVPLGAGGDDGDDDEAGLVVDDDAMVGESRQDGGDADSDVVALADADEAPPATDAQPEPEVPLDSGTVGSPDVAAATTDGGDLPDVDASHIVGDDMGPTPGDAAPEPRRDGAVPPPRDGGGRRADGGAQPRGAPDTEIIRGPAELTNEPDAVFFFRSDDPDARFECQLDRGAWLQCRSGDALGPLRDGPHTFTVVAINADGLLDRVPPSHRWVIDTDPPDTRLDRIGQFGHRDGCRPQSGIEVGFSADERDSVFRCETTVSYDEGADEAVHVEACTSPFRRAYPCVDERTVDATVRVWATDPAGNVEVAPLRAPGRSFLCAMCD
jgi:hypothetical protein